LAGLSRYLLTANPSVIERIEKGRREIVLSKFGWLLNVSVETLLTHGQDICPPKMKRRGDNQG
jgi:hypothetical protein